MKADENTIPVRYLARGDELRFAGHWHRIVNLEDLGLWRRAHFSDGTHVDLGFDGTVKTRRTA